MIYNERYNKTIKDHELRSAHRIPNTRQKVNLWLNCIIENDITNGCIIFNWMLRFMSTVGRGWKNGLTLGQQFRYVMFTRDGGEDIGGSGTTNEAPAK